MKRTVTFFLSYAHEDRDDVERFRKVLGPNLKTSARFEFREWRDQGILPGERWRAEIEEALEQACFGLLLVSPEFLASEFITRNELPPLLDRPMVVPVALQRIPLDGAMDLKGLEERQVFRDAKGRAFDVCRAGPERREFAQILVRQIEALLEKYPC